MNPTARFQHLGTNLATLAIAPFWGGNFGRTNNQELRMLLAFVADLEFDVAA